MKKAMTEYISALSDNDFDILEQIIENKYRKFIQLYWLLREYSENITYLKYKDTSHDMLKIEMKLSGIDINKAINQLLDNVNGSGLIEITLKDGIIHIEITNDESELS